MPSKPRPGRAQGADIFIGGGLDDQPGFGVMRDYVSGYRRETGRDAECYANHKAELVDEAIRQGNRRGGPVNVVGHSWGGTDAYNAAARAAKAGLRVDNLVTLDPVGGNLWLARAKGPALTGNWANIQASPTKLGLNEVMALAGGKPSQLPIRLADQRAMVPADHADVDRMMRDGGGRAVLDRSRRSADDDPLGDRLPTPEWMRRRNAGVLGR